ncbi:MAG: maleylpyruvate isomerase N-terminal domain-containing protein [Acidimicrobiales bacterium]
MHAARHLQILAAEGGRVAALPADALDAPVPSLDDWTVERVVRHLAKLHHWVRGALALPADGAMADIGPLPEVPKGAACLPAYRDSLDLLLAEVERRDPDEACASFIGRESVGWWLRRQAHEVTVHRIDAQDAVHAAGGPAPDPIEADAAADGIDEWARVFLAVRYGQRFGAIPDQLQHRTVHIHGTDDPAPADGAEWLLAFGNEGVSVEATHAKGDVALRGPSADLLLVLWRRRPLDVLGPDGVVGDATVADQLLEAAQF